MSTRGLLGFVHNEQVRASFNHFDSYLEGLGKSIAELCSIVIDWDAFTHSYEKINWEEEFNESRQYLGGKEIMLAIMKDNSLTLRDEKDFSNDDLFCEYAYLINLDTRVLEVYSSNYQTDHDQSEAHMPLNLLATYPLHEIPHDWVDILNEQKIAIDIDWKDKLRKRGIEPNDLEL